MLIPYMADLELPRRPYMTLAVCLLCLFVYSCQSQNEDDIWQAAIDSCEEGRTRMLEVVLKKITGEPDIEACVQFMLALYETNDKDALIDYAVTYSDGIAGLSPADSRAYTIDLINTQYRRFTRQAPPSLTRKLAYAPETWNPIAMITSDFAHGDWWHVIGNVIFFFAFAATVEAIIGRVLFLGVLLGLSIMTGVMFSITQLAIEQETISFGLSGIVMGMIALYAFFLPSSYVRCYFLLLPFYKQISVPAWILAGWFIGWNIFELFRAFGETNINYVSHVTGAALGYLLGVVFFQRRKEDIQKLVRDRITNRHRLRTRFYSDEW